jgi:hypothetical protein
MITGFIFIRPDKTRGRGPGILPAGTPRFASHRAAEARRLSVCTSTGFRRLVLRPSLGLMYHSSIL